MSDLKNSAALALTAEIVSAKAEKPKMTEWTKEKTKPTTSLSSLFFLLLLLLLFINIPQFLWRFPRQISF